MRNLPTTKKLTDLDLSILKYYKEGNDLCGFEDVHDNLVATGYLDGDLELTMDGYKFIKEFDGWNDIKSFVNKTKITIS